MEASEPISYLTLEEGTPVLEHGGEQIGTVTHVLADAADDIFDGLVIASKLASGAHRFVDASEIESMSGDGVHLRLDRDSCLRLPEPSANPAAMAADPAEDEGPLHAKLRRAWDLISGKY